MWPSRDSTRPRGRPPRWRPDTGSPWLATPSRSSGAAPPAVGGKRGADQPQHEEREGHGCGVLAALVQVLDDVGEATLRQAMSTAAARTNSVRRWGSMASSITRWLQRVEYDGERSEERRVGKEWRCRWRPNQSKVKQ